MKSPAENAAINSAGDKQFGYGSDCRSAVSLRKNAEKEVHANAMIKGGHAKEERKLHRMIVWRTKLKEEEAEKREDKSNGFENQRCFVEDGLQV